MRSPHACLCRKHPRLRGEDRFSPALSATWKETPPLARGRLRLNQSRFLRSRNTPACAGKTGRNAGSHLSQEKHPRLRGEDHAERLNGRRAVGNTPACAGKTQELPILNTLDFGNTPACAGKTGRKRKRSQDKGKHPRLRGEDRTVVGVLRRLRKHPRLRGEDFGAECGSFLGLETPPLARGRLIHLEDSRRHQGNTPACAGKTAPPCRHVVVMRKHPRLRGEDDSESFEEDAVQETPPLARGRQCWEFLSGRT